LLLFDSGNDAIPKSMQLVAGRTGQEYNNRRTRKGAFWEDRYHATAIESDDHLLRCITYIDLNMVRAGAVNHPAEWDVAGYSEIQKPWKRKGVIDFHALTRLLGADSQTQLATILKSAAEEALPESCRNGIWSESIGVGSESFLAELKVSIGQRVLHRSTEFVNGQTVLREAGCAYFAKSADKCAE
jgi:putative transposase